MAKRKKSAAKRKPEVKEGKRNQLCELNVEGMHCAACEIQIEKKILKKFKGVDSVDASLADGKVKIYFDGKEPDLKLLNNEFEEDGYRFSTSQIEQTPSLYFDQNRNLIINTPKFKKQVGAFGVALGVLILFWALEDIIQESGADYTGIQELLDPSASWSVASYLIILLTGVVAGFSTCASLVGGLLLSMSKQWQRVYSSAADTVYRKSFPYLMFNAGRLALFPLFGALLGGLGKFFTLTIEFNALLIVAVGLLMGALGAQMIGIRRFRDFTVQMPRFISRKIADEENFNGKWMPFLLGGLTFFIPCGFTTIAQAVALVTGDPLKGGVVMLLFALGTLPSLSIISAMSIFSQKSLKFNQYFGVVAGYLVLFFGIQNVNSQFKILGVPNSSYLSNFYTLVELGLYLLLFFTLTKLVYNNIKALNFVDGYSAKLYRLVLAFLYLLLLINLLINYDMILLPWSYSFRPL